MSVFNRGNQKSYTLIEMLLVVSILSMMSLALFHTLANGLKIWERARKSVVEEDAAIFFDKINQDLRNSFFYSKITFTGKENRIRFATRIKDVRVQGEEFFQGMGAVEYYFDPNRKNLYRRQLTYGQALRGDPGKERLLLSSVGSVHFVYYFLQGNEAVLKREIDTSIPRAVAVEVEFLDGREKRSLRKLINLPQGS